MPVRKSSRRRPRCIVIAGPNGAGKTTFAREFLPKEGRIIHFVNADAIASGLSALKPELVSVTAGRLFLRELDRLAAARTDFAFESTLSGLAHAVKLKKWKLKGYEIQIIYLSIKSPGLALGRIAARVEQGGHNVPRADVVRRFARSIANFRHVYKDLADRWTLYDNSGRRPIILEEGS